MPFTLRIVELRSGGPSPADGEYLVEYDPTRDGVGPDGVPMIAHVVTSPDRGDARVFGSVQEVHEAWSAVDPRNPTRPDGLPNRPLTAFSVEIERLP